MNTKCFGDLPSHLQNISTAKAVIVPIPLEKTTTYQKGTRHGPVAILKASEQLEFFDEVLNQQVARCGIHTDQFVDCRDSLENCVNRIYHNALQWFQLDKFPIFLGGEHSISIGIFKAIKEVFGPISIVQIDAHADLRDSYHGSQLNHACVMSRALEEDHRLIQIGVRALSKREYDLCRTHQNIHTFFDHDGSWKQNNFQDVIKEIKSPAYITLDVDGLDPSIMNATGTPVPGGLSWHQLNYFFSTLFDHVNIIGADINELSPIDHFHACDFLCARIAYRLIGLKSKQESWPLIDPPLTEEDD